MLQRLTAGRFVPSLGDAPLQDEILERIFLRAPHGAFKAAVKARLIPQGAAGFHLPQNPGLTTRRGSRVGREFDRCLRRIKSWRRLRVVPALTETRSEGEAEFERETTSNKWIRGVLSSRTSLSWQRDGGDIRIICAPGAAAAAAALQ